MVVFVKKAKLRAMPPVLVFWSLESSLDFAALLFGNLPPGLGGGRSTSVHQYLDSFFLVFSTWT